MSNKHFGEYVPIDQLVPNDEWNPRQIKDDSFKKGCDLMAKRGWLENLVVNQHESAKNVIISGNQRFRIAQHLRSSGKKDFELAPVNYVNLDFNDPAQLKEAQKMSIELNNKFGEWDFDILSSFDFTPAEFDAMNFDMKAFEKGFDIDLKAIDWETGEDKHPDKGNEDEIPEPIQKIIIKTGDLIELGRHRLLCGDSTKKEDVERLMNGEKADMVFTDPPYGIKEPCDKRNSREKNSIAKSNIFKKIAGDDNVDTAKNSFKLINEYNIPIQIWWGANYYSHLIPESGNWLVWDKRVEEHQKDNNSDCELAWVKSKANSVRIFRHLWKGLIKASEHGEKRVHPTQKPIALAEWCFDYYNSEAKTILDIFLGSGSTLIACEKTNRKCYGIEIDPHYCQVIIQRYVDYTKNNSIKINGNQVKWDQIISNKAE